MQHPPSITPILVQLDLTYKRGNELYLGRSRSCIGWGVRAGQEYKVGLGQIVSNGFSVLLNENGRLPVNTTRTKLNKRQR